MSDEASSSARLDALDEYRELRGFFQRRVGCYHEAQELTQETFARLFRWCPDRRVENLRGLLFRIARNLLIDRARARGSAVTEPLTDETIEKTPSLEASPSQRAEAADQLRLVQRAVKALPERCQEVFVLNRFGGLSYAAIAAKLSIAPSTVEKHMIRALAACKAALAESAR